MMVRVVDVDRVVAVVEEAAITLSVVWMNKYKHRAKLNAIEIPKRVTKGAKQHERREGRAARKPIKEVIRAKIPTPHTLL